jgi:CubicO group peptidase (beta-lactamase class C family)
MNKEDRIKDMLNLESGMSKWKQAQPLDFVNKATQNYNFPNWQTGNDESVYYNLNIASFFKTRIVMPPAVTSILERDLQPELLDISFNNVDGSINPTLEEYLKGPKQVQAMMMAHKGKVVFETYPGMNPSDLHVWMSASKTTASLMLTLLWEEGKLDFDNMVSAYVPDLKGSAWDHITVKNAMNMAAGLDMEETFENLVNPKTVISHFFSAVFDAKGDWKQLLKEAKPLEGEKPGDRFRYSSAITMALVLIAQNITQKPWEALWKERVWSKMGARNPFVLGLAPDGTPIPAGMNNTTPEDMLRYAMLYTPSWNKVAKEQVVSDKVLKRTQTLGSPEAYHKSTEEVYGTRWFGEVPYMNTAQWDHSFEDGAMFKHGNMGQGIYVDPARDFCGCYFGLATNDESISGVDHSPGYLRTAAKMLAGK